MLGIDEQQMGYEARLSGVADNQVANGSWVRDSAFVTSLLDLSHVTSKSELSNRLSSPFHVLNSARICDSVADVVDTIA